MIDLSNFSDSILDFSDFFDYDLCLDWDNKSYFLSLSYEDFLLSRDFFLSYFLESPSDSEPISSDFLHFFYFFFIRFFGITTWFFRTTFFRFFRFLTNWFFRFRTWFFRTPLSDLETLLSDLEPLSLESFKILHLFWHFFLQARR